MHEPEYLEFPSAWLQALHPRRTGRPGWQYTVTDTQMERLQEWRVGGGGFYENVLTNPLSDPHLVELATADTLTEQTAGVWLAIERGDRWYGDEVAVAEDCIRRLGLPAAAAAFVESLGSRVVHGHQLAADGSGQALVSVGSVSPEVFEDRIRGAQTSLLDHVRRELSATDALTWQDAVDRVGPYRLKGWESRLATSYLFPDRRDWVAADLAELPANSGSWTRAPLALFSGFLPEHLTGVVASRLDEIVTAVDAVGEGAVPLLEASLDWYCNDSDARRVILDALGRIGSESAMEVLVARAVRADVCEAIEATAALRPERAALVLGRHREDSPIDTLIMRHLRRHPELAEPSGLRKVHPVVAASKTPAILRDPPWNRPQPKAVSVTGPSLGPLIRWLDGERESWSWDRWPTFEPTHYDQFYTTRPDWARFWIGGSEEAVRPRLATWRAEETSFYLNDPRVLVAKYELDAYPPVLRLARRKPIVGAELLLPYLSDEVALLMAKWLAGSRQFGELARRWFERHGEIAVGPLIPAALGRPSTVGRSASLALMRLDPELVRAAAHTLGCTDAGDVLLGRDPMDNLPSSVPAVPAWLDVEVLPQVLTRDRQSALSPEHTRTLCRLVAISQLDEPYAGIAAVAQQLDPASLAEFAWQLYNTWHIVGRPSKDSWAMDALGYFGDERTADRLAPLVRRWPSDGAAQRAKRGAEVLAVMANPVAVRHLSALARNAKSTPLRKHAAAALDRLATDRGLLPEQLDDLLAPAAGLDGDPFTYRGVTYRRTISSECGLILSADDGHVVTVLPRPTTPDEQMTVSEWKANRRTAAREIADQLQRLEQAMIMQRSWSYGDFTGRIVGHPLLGRLAQRLIWSIGDRLGVIDPLGDLVDRVGGLLLEAQPVRLAHPAVDDLTAWRQWLADRDFRQPFEQVGRDVYDGDPSQHWNQEVTAASLFTLVQQGWHWGPSGRQARRNSLLRAVGANGSVVLHIAPGVSAVHDVASEPAQTIDHLEFRSAVHGELGLFSDLNRVTRSELLRDLARLTSPHK